ncbi:MAG: DNA polymerase III subunit delta [Roseivirga sp.]|nr:DNA polymerase III subunit delta [Roseivirga sp.]
MSNTPEKVLADLKAGKYAPVYFLQGDEPYYIDQIADYIEDHCLSEAEKGFNQTIMYGKDVTMAQVLTNAKRFPMMAERQVVIVKEAKDIQDINKEEGQKLLMHYLDQPVPSTVLVFAHKHKNLDGRKPLAKAAKAKSVFVATAQLRDYQLPQWIEDYIRQKGYGINDRSIMMLSEYVGTNLERLTNEIGKMLINLKEGDSINEDLVQKYVGISKDYNVFELQRAISFRDPVKANRIVRYFAANAKANPIIPMIALLYSFYSKLLIFHGTKDKSDQSLTSAMGVRPFALKEYKAAARSYPLGKVMQNISFLRKADLKSKGVDSGAAADGEVLKELVFLLMH